jgi:quinol monooxygenase YgiN
MAFIQIIKYRTSRPDEVAKLEQSMQDSGRTPRFTRIAVGQDKDAAGTYYTIVEFPSAAAAQENNDDPATQAFAAKMMELCDGPAEFTNIDVLRTM